MPHRPKKTKKTAAPKSGVTRAEQLAEKRRTEWAVRTTLAKFQNRSSERK